MTLEDLMQIRSADRATIYRHLAALRERATSALSESGKYQFVIYPLRLGIGRCVAHGWRSECFHR